MPAVGARPAMSSQAPGRPSLILCYPAATGGRARVTVGAPAPGPNAVDEAGHDV